MSHPQDAPGPNQDNEVNHVVLGRLSPLANLAAASSQSPTTLPQEGIDHELDAALEITAKLRSDDSALKSDCKSVLEDFNTQVDQRLQSSTAAAGDVAPPTPTSMDNDLYDVASTPDGDVESFTLDDCTDEESLLVSKYLNLPADDSITECSARSDSTFETAIYLQHRGCSPIPDSPSTLEPSSQLSNPEICHTPPSSRVQQWLSNGRVLREAAPSPETPSRAELIKRGDVVVGCLMGGGRKKRRIE
ncbi:hypothetical protein P7C70_g1337, partial [Phenoliferia sp. Uapishka_3]